jgi:L-ascorbate metabolism protein UlaG (beta-lactamase superfamily)
MNRLYCRRDFLLGGAAAVATSAAIPSFAGAQAASVPVRRSADLQSRLITKWDEASEEVSPKVYCAYLRDGDTRGYRALTANAFAFEKVMREVKATVVTGDVPAIWSVYNMGYIVKTRESLFSIDLNHRRGTEFAPLLDFALITHNHGDHWRKDFYDAMTGQGKIVASNFLDNPRFNEMKGDSAKGVGTYRIKDVEIRTSLIDHSDAAWGINFTMAFEIRIGNWLLYHTGDSGRGTEPKLVTPWGRPDLWLFFPGCGINTAKAVEKINAKRIVFGHLWELGHKTRHRGRLDEPLIRRALAAARPIVKDTSLAFWGDRIV